MPSIFITIPGIDTAEFSIMMLSSSAMTSLQRILIGTGIIIVGIFLYTHRLTLFTRSPKTPSVPIKVATISPQNVDVTQSTIGEVQSFSTVNISAQVSGQIQAVKFDEGSLVQQDQALFLIDPRPYEAALEQAKATLAHDQALLWSANLLVQRQEALVKKGFVSKQDFDSTKANAESLAGQVDADDAQVKQAELNLEYCTISAPISGRTGNIFVKAGNNVVANQTNTPLVTINQIQPIYVSFSLPENVLHAIQTAWRNKSITVMATSGHSIEKGTLTFIDNQVNNSTGTIQMKALFNNADLKLWPGQYVQVTIPVKSLENALIAPAESVSIGQNGAYVYLLKPNQTVSYQSVKTGPTLSQGIVIKSGLKIGDKVVTDGLLKITDGSKVEVVPS